jgi:hypothetical protein
MGKANEDDIFMLIFGGLNERDIQGNVEFGYQLSIYSKDRGKARKNLIEARLIIFKNSVRTSKRTPHFTITDINLLTLFKEIIPV